MSPVQRTLQHLREHGYTAAKAEYWNHFAKRRIDLLGFIDVVAVSDNHMLMIQTTDGEHFAAHIDKIMASPVARLEAKHCDVEVWSWSLRLTRDRRKDGLLNRKKEWLLRREKVFQPQC
jgi:hypothetical protein